jgi:AcrR family transcriptional regulator
MPRTTSPAPPASLPNKHQARTEATKKKLIEAAYDIFTRDGFVGARIEDIAAHAGFSRGAFYAHFQSKNDLFFGLMEAKAEQKHSGLRRLIQRRKTPAQKLAAFREYYVANSADRQWVMLLVEFKLYAIREPKLHQQLAEAHRDLRARLNSWMREAGIGAPRQPFAESDDLRAALEGAYMGLVLERAYDPRRLPDARMRELLGRVFDSVTA